MIYEMLLEGAENAISAKDLADMLGCKPRDISEQVEAERRDGKPIVASCSRTKPGYYLAGDKETMQDYCGRLLHRMGEIAATRNACLKTIDNLPARSSRAEAMPLQDPLQITMW